MVPSFKKKLKLKLQKAQNKCTRFCLNLHPRSHIDPYHFRKINWLLVSDRVEYCIANTIFKYWNGNVPGYIHEVFRPSLCRYSTRSVGTGHNAAENNYRAKKLTLLRAKNMVQNRP